MISALFLLAILSVFGGVISRGRLRKSFRCSLRGSISAIFLLIAILVIFKSQVQQGKFLAGYGPMMNFLLPARDLYIPLVSQEMSSEKSENSVLFSHKYVGRHSVIIIFPESSINIESMDVPALQYDVYLNGVIIYTKSVSHSLMISRPYNSIQGPAFKATSYSVPRDIPVRRELNATISIKGDLKGIVEKYGTLYLEIRKDSDE